MKRMLVTGLLFLLAWQIRAADAPPDYGQSNDAPYAVTDRTANSRVWQRTTYETGPDGESMPVSHNYTELATGMHYQDANGQWVESKAEIDILPNNAGAAATNGQHKVIFPPDLYNGQIELNTPDGKWLRSQVLGLSYFDTTSGQSVLIAEATNSVAQLASSNVVIYANAFTDFTADVRYTYTRAGFEQDIIMRQQPPSPTVYGLNPETTHLQVLTEFLSPPTPAICLCTNGGLTDQRLDFGAMKIGRGKAFALENESTNFVRSVHNSITVTKQWLTLDGRNFLVEEVEFKKVAPKLQELPPAPEIASLKSASPKSALHRVVAGRALPAPHLARQSTNVFQIAKVNIRHRQGYVLDYVTLTTTSDFTFRGDKTYYVSGEVSLYGTTTFEGGTVIKYATDGQIDINSAVVCKTGPYRPVTFTVASDSTIGEYVGSSDTSVSEFLYLNNSIKLRYARFSHSVTSIEASGEDLDLWDCVFVDTSLAVDTAGSNLSLHNVLLQQTAGVNDIIINFYTENFLAENVTVDAGDFYNNDNDPSTISVLNSVESKNQTLGHPFFQTVGAGSHYLTNSSPYRDSGTTNISAELLAELRQKTTYPPDAFSYSNITINADLTLGPLVQRDTDVPDKGYHYDPIDYFVSGAVTNATLTLTNGVVVAYGIGDYGFRLDLGGSLNSQGTATRMNRIVYPRWAQEQSRVYGYGNLQDINYAIYSRAVNTINMQFTSVVAGPAEFDVIECNGNATLKNCEFYNTSLTLWRYTDPGLGTYTLQNNLFVYPYVVVSVGTNGFINNYNNLYVGDSGSRAEFSSTGTTTGMHRDNVIDGFNAIMNGSPDYNALVNGATCSTNPVHGLTNSIVWVPGPLGDYYQPITSPLINMGSRAASNAGLYHFTVTTNLISGQEIKETNTTVDIGYHYVALDSGGNPIDADGDGVPDYLEDANGNGSADSGESNWQNYESQNGLATGSGLQLYTPLK